MSKSHKPLAGSRAYWPRKRAARIHPSVKKRAATGEKVAPMAFAGYKAGMTSVGYIDTKKGSVTHGEELVQAATILDCPPMIVYGMKLYRKTDSGLVNEGTVLAEKLEKDLGKRIKLPKKPHMKKELMGKKLDELNEVRLMVHTQPRKSGIGKKKPELFEVPISGDIDKQWAYALEKLGNEIKPEDVFSQGETIDVRAVSKGKGFAGVVKRFGVKIRGRKHTKKRRHIGVLAPRTPSRVLPGAVAVPGQHGFHTRTEYNKKVLKIGEDGFGPKGGFVKYGVVPKNYILLDGSIPGPKKRLIVLEKGTRAKGKPEPVEVKFISDESHQG